MVLLLAGLTFACRAHLPSERAAASVQSRTPAATSSPAAAPAEAPMVSAALPRLDDLYAATLAPLPAAAAPHEAAPSLTNPAGTNSQLPAAALSAASPSASLAPEALAMATTQKAPEPAVAAASSTPALATTVSAPATGTAPPAAVNQVELAKAEPIAPPAPLVSPPQGPAAPSVLAPSLVTRLPGPAANVTAKEATVRFVSHRSCLVDFAGLHVLFAASDLKKLVGPKRGKRPRRLALPKGRIDAVAIGSLDAQAMEPAVARALWRQYRPTFLTPAGGRARLARLGIKRDHIVEQASFAARPTGTKGFAAALVPSHLPTSHLSFSKPKAAAGFVLTTKDHTLYFAGESAFGKQFAEVKDRFGAPDVAILNVVAGADIATAKQHNHTLTLVEAAHAQAILSSKVAITLPAKASISHASAVGSLTGTSGCFITPKNSEVVHVVLGAEGACESQHAAANRSVQSVRLGSSIATPAREGGENRPVKPETSVEKLPLSVP